MTDPSNPIWQSPTSEIQPYPDSILAPTQDLLVDEWKKVLKSLYYQRWQAANREKKRESERRWRTANRELPNKPKETQTTWRQLRLEHYQQEHPL